MRKKIIRILVQAFLKQFFIDGYFHGDPHPGNLGYKIDSTGPYIVFYDLGLSCSLTPSLRTSLGKLIGLIIAQDSEGILDECREIGVLTPEARRDPDILESVYAFIDAIPNNQLSVESIGELKVKLSGISDNGSINFPTELTLMGRTLVILEGTFATFQAMHPGLDLGDIVVSEALPIMDDIIGTSGGLFERATNDLQRSLNFLGSILRTSRTTFLEIERGTVKLPVSTPETDRSLRRLKTGVKSTNAAIIAAAFFVSGVIMLAFGPWILGILLIFISLFAFERWLIAERRMEK